ncbi:MAG: alpha/beta hydrolase [Desulfobacula sp.]|nr:alpha/beta hydrolase [Desulfobacula sp.]
MIQEQRIEVQWHCSGPPENPTLVFLHEGLGCVDLWKDVPLQLSQMTQCNAFVFSRLGYGKSDESKIPKKINFMHREALGFLPAVLDAAKIKDHILIGHSDGGSMGIIYGGSPHSVHLKGLIIEAAHVFCEPLTVDSIQKAKNDFLKHDLKNKLEKYHGQNIDTAFWGWNDIWLSPGFMNWDIEKFLKYIKIPVLALQGRQDQYGTLEQLSAIKAGIETCDIKIIDNCGHSPHHEQQETVLAIMANFIRKLIADQEQRKNSKTDNKIKHGLQFFCI